MNTDAILMKIMTEKLHTLARESMPYEERCALIIDVNKRIKTPETDLSLDRLGEDLAYLFAAIARGATVKWKITDFPGYSADPRALAVWLLTECGAQHPVWNFIEVS